MKNNRLCFIALYVIGMFFYCWYAFAQTSTALLTLEVTGYKERIVANKKGHEIVDRRPLEDVGPGDIIVYEINYRNTGSREVKDAEIVYPIPANSLYILKSAAGKKTDIMFSVDGGNSYQKGWAQYVTAKFDGTPQYKTAPASMYTHIKWVIKQTVLPGKGGVVSFKVKMK